MTVCRFFMQGNCRYGNNCWNEHPTGGSGYAYSAQRQLFGGGGGGRGGRGGGGQHSVTFRDSFGSSGNQSQYRWTASDSQKQQGQKQTTVQVSPNDVINTLINEIQEWEQNKMWPFSCIGIEKDCPCLPDFDDKSPEELREEAYEAIKSGNGQTYQLQVQKLATDYYNKRQMLKNPGMQLKQKLMSLIEDYRIKKNSRTGSSFGNSSVSLFSNTSGSSGTSSFGSATQQNTNVFGSSPSNAQNLFGSSNPFGTSQTGALNLTGTSGSFGTSQTGATGLFGTGQSGTSGSFGTSSPFGVSQTGASGPFGTTQTGTSSPFGTAQTGSAGLFGKAPTGSAFGATPVVSSTPFGTAQTSSFGSTQTAFGSNTTFSSTPVSGAGSPFGNTSGGFGVGTGSVSTPSVNLFGTPPAGQGLFSSTSGGPADGNSPLLSSGQSSFGAFGGNQSSSVAPSVGLFGKPAQQPQSQTSQTSVYTPLDKLTQEELAAFQAQTFTLGKIPTKPPPRELCF